MRGNYGKEYMSELTKTKPPTDRTALLASIVDCSDDAIIAKTPDGVITSWNRGAELIMVIQPAK